MEINSFPSEEKWAYENSLHYLSRLSYVNNIYVQLTEARNERDAGNATENVILFGVHIESQSGSVCGSGVIELYCFTNRIHLYYSHKDNLWYSILLLFTIRFTDCTLHFAGSKYLIFQNDCKMLMNSTIDEYI